MISPQSIRACLPLRWAKWTVSRLNSPVCKASGLFVCCSTGASFDRVEMAMLSPADDLKIVWSSVSSARSKHCTLLRKKSRCFGLIIVCQLCNFFFPRLQETQKTGYTLGDLEVMAALVITNKKTNWFLDSWTTSKEKVSRNIHFLEISLSGKGDPKSSPKSPGRKRTGRESSLFFEFTRKYCQHTHWTSCTANY